MTTTTPATLVSIREASRRAGISHASIIAWLKDGRLQDHGTAHNPRGKAARLVALEDVERVKAARYTETVGLVQRRKDEAAAGIPLEGSPIGLGEAARKYGASRQLLSIWAEKGEIIVYQYPAERGDKLLVDERSVWERMKTFVPRNKGQRRLIPQHPPRTTPRATPASPTQGQEGNLSVGLAPIAEQSGGKSQYRTSDLVEEYLVHRRHLVANGKLAPQTVRDDEYHLGLFAAAVPISPPTLNQLERWDAERQAKGLTGTTRSTTMAKVVTFLGWLSANDQARNIRSRLPDTKGLTPSRDTKRPTPPTTSQLTLILGHARAHSLFDYAILQTLRLNGIRSWSLRELTWEAMKEYNYTAFQTNAKTKKRAVFISVPADLRMLMDQASPNGATRKGFVFPGPTGRQMTREHLRDLVARHFDGAGVDIPRKGPYIIRHYFGLIAKQTVGLEKAAMLMGNSIAMMEKVYGKEPNEYIAETYQLVKGQFGILDVGQQDLLPGFDPEPAHVTP